jgi:hypothetical protein
MNLEKIIKDEKKRTSVADFTAAVTGSLLFGSTTDYLSGIRTIEKWIGSRLFNGAVAASSGKFYGNIRDYAFDITRTTENSHWLRKYAVEFLAFNTLPTTTYGLAVGLMEVTTKAIFDHNFHLDHTTMTEILSKSWDAYVTVVYTSPLYCYVLPKWNDLWRKIFKVLTPSEKASVHYHEKINT